MKIIAHRGIWRQPIERNSLAALTDALKYQFGVETDVRDACGKLVISHDMPSGPELTFEELIRNALALPIKPCPVLAINIKADGLANKIFSIIKDHKSLDYFFFDMSVPDMRSYIKLRMPIYTRMSEVEKTPIWIDSSVGVWLDAFESEWYEIGLISNLLKLGKKVCIISPELHGRKHADFWISLNQIPIKENLLLCTDFPFEANSFFLERNND